MFSNLFFAVKLIPVFRFSKWWEVRILDPKMYWLFSLSLSWLDGHDLAGGSDIISHRPLTKQNLLVLGWHSVEKMVSVSPELFVAGVTMHQCLMISTQERISGLSGDLQTFSKTSHTSPSGRNPFFPRSFEQSCPVTSPSCGGFFWQWPRPRWACQNRTSHMQERHKSAPSLAALTGRGTVA